MDKTGSSNSKFQKPRLHRLRNTYSSRFYAVMPSKLGGNCTLCNAIAIAAILDFQCGE